MNRIPADSHYMQTMDEAVVPYLEERKESGTFERVPGQMIYYEHFAADDPKATVVLVHGFTEGIGKFRETVYYFLQNGFHVWQIQQREHGKSFRSTDDPALIHITDYQDLIKDLHYFVKEIVKKAQDPPAEQEASQRGRDADGRPLYLFGHSMGGGVSACYLERYPEDFRKAVLSSPMLELSSGGIPVWAAVLYAKAVIALGKGRNYMPGSAPFSGEPDFENSCTNCEERYNYWFREVKNHVENQMCVSAVSTAMEFLKLTKEATDPANCRKIRADVLLFQAGQDTIVKPGGQEAFIRHTGKRARLVRYENARHEIYICTDDILDQYWKEILDFFR